jgi:hypothetical protein
MVFSENNTQYTAELFNVPNEKYGIHCQTKHVSDRRDGNTGHLQINGMIHTRCICGGGHWWAHLL